MPNGTYGGVRGKETKVGQKTFVSRPTRFSTWARKNSSEVSFHSSEVSFHSSEVLFRVHVEGFYFPRGCFGFPTSYLAETVNQRDRRGVSEVCGHQG